MIVLITGARGVNGRPAARHLADAGYAVVTTSQAPLGGPPRPEKSAHIFEAANVLDFDRILHLLNKYKVTVVVHLAAAMPDALTATPERAWKVNTIGTWNVLEAARQAPSVQRIIYASSRSVYGQVEESENLHPVYAPVREDHVLRPRGPYGLSKFEGELLTQAYAERFGLQGVVLRFAHIVGADKLARHGVLAVYERLLEGAATGTEVHLPQGSDQCDDVIYVEDVAAGIAAAVGAPLQSAYAVYNIATGRPTRMGDFVERVKRRFPDAPIEVGPGLDFYRLGLDHYLVFDTEAARNHLHFVAAYDLDRMIDHYIETARLL